MPKATQSITSLDDIEELREYEIGRQLEAAGLRLQRAPLHLNGGYHIMSGNQVLAGRGRRDYEMSLDQVQDFARRAGVIR